MKNLKLGVKIGIGFAVILSLTIIVGYSGFSALKSVVSETDFYRGLDEVKSSFALAATQSDRYLIYNYSEGRSNQADALDGFKSHIQACKEKISAVLTQQNSSQEMVRLVKKIETGIGDFEDSFNKLTAIESAKINDAEKIFALFITIEEKSQWFDTVKAGSILLKADCEGYFQRHTDAKWQSILQHLKSFAKAISGWEEQVQNNKMMNKMFFPIKERFVKLNPLLNQYQEAVVRQTELTSNLNRSKADVNNNLLSVRDISFKKMDSERHNSNIVILISVLSAVLIGIIYGMMTTRAIVKPIQSIVIGMQDIAEGQGDLTKRLDVNSCDEVGELAINFNLFIERIHSLIQDVSHNAMSLDNASGDLKSIAATMCSDSGRATKKASAVAVASQELSVNMNSVAAAMEQAATNVNTVSASAEEMTSTINEIAKNSENAREMTSSAVSRTATASRQIDELGEAAKEIGKVVETITAISDMVNLLALNATIEAARAGDAGRGFAVVANEIKELARQTSNASNEIKDKVGGIQSTTKTTTSHITAIGKVVNEVNEMITIIATSVEEQSATTNEIAGNVSQVSVGISEVNQNVAQSNAGVSDISNEITLITSISNEINSNSNKVNESAVTLAEMAGKLKAVVGKFKL